MIDFKKLLASIIICQIIGVLGAIFTIQSISTWYPTLQKPAFTPPSWIFAPVWTALFLLMGLSLYFVWVKKKSLGGLEIKIFGLQLILNFLWSVLFFGLRNPFFAFVEMIIFFISILATATVFYRIKKLSGLLLVPYILWVMVALYLNYGIWILN